MLSPFTSFGTMTTRVLTGTSFFSVARFKTTTAQIQPICDRNSGTNIVRAIVIFVVLLTKHTTELLFGG
jgi:hypothetical protein